MSINLRRSSSSSTRRILIGRLMGLSFRAENRRQLSADARKSNFKYFWIIFFVHVITHAIFCFLIHFQHFIKKLILFKERRVINIKNIFPFWTWYSNTYAVLNTKTWISLCLQWKTITFELTNYRNKNQFG
jgi:hypothetical protein